MNSKTALTYDDINLIPAYSEIESRQNISLETQLTTNYKLMVPLIASPMDTVCESDMAIAMAELGGVGCIHRFMSIEHQVKEVKKVVHNVDGLLIYNLQEPLKATNFHQNPKVYVTSIGMFNYQPEKGIAGVWKDMTVPIMAAVGANGDYLERAVELTNAGANVILIDVAHGHHKFVKDAIRNLKKTLPTHVDIIAGNVATAQGAKDLENWGVDGIRSGVGGGSLCSTRIKTGFGIPNVTSIEDCSSEVTVPIIACGGIRNSGDIAKALAVGASSVILGSLLAGTEETPGPIIERENGLYKRYRGAASLETKTLHGQVRRNVEGESTVVPYKGGVKFVVEGLLDGLRSALSYAGADSIKNFHPEYVQVTSAGINEAKPHLL